MGTASWIVPGITCDHCKRSIEAEVSPLPGVEAVHVDVESKRVVVHGDAEPEAITAALAEAGFEDSTRE